MSDSSSSPGKCPQCGAALPAGAADCLCPVCLMAQAMAPTQPDETAMPPKAALTPAELAPHFPQLEILECLGRGGMGVVYKARQKSLNRLVALKLLAPERVGDSHFAERFQREAQALAALSHPHIVTVHDFGQAGGFYFLLMEFVDGVNLRQAMMAGRFSPEQALAIVPPVCEALQYAHEHGVVHRDIKPENLLLDKDGRVKIADFGIARMLGAPHAATAHSDLPNATSSQLVGTPQYMAPEQKERRATDHRADIYSLGVVLYELLTGELPADKLQPPSRKVTIDVRLDEIVLRALEREPELRYQTATDFRTQVEGVTQNFKAPAATPPSSGKEREPVPVLRWTDRWMWDTSNLLLLILVPGILSLLLVVALYPVLGARANWALLLTLAGGFAAAIYGWVGHRVRGLKADAATTGAEVVEALIFKRPFQSPGIAALFSDRLELRRIIGSPLLIPLGDIASLSEVTWFNGSRLVGKRGFELNLKNGQRIGVAVPEAFGDHWLARLRSIPMEVGQPRPAQRSRLFTWVALNAEGRRRPSWHVFLLRVLIAIVIALPVRQFVVRSYLIAGSSVEPEMPTGSYVAVWLLGHSYHPGDIIAYDQDGKAFVARVVRSDGNTVTVNRNRSPDETIPLSRVAGRVVSVYWRATPKAADTAGIGVGLKEENGHFLVGSVLPGLPAARDGRLKPGDMLLRMGEDGKPLEGLEGWTLEKCRDGLRGAEGGKVSIFVVPAGKTAADGYKLTLTRQQLPLVEGVAKEGKDPATTRAEDEIILLAQEHLSEVRANYDKGVVPWERVVEAVGQLALAEARDDAVKQAQARLDTATKLVPLVEARFKVGAATQAELNYVQSLKLVAELEVQRLRSGGNSKTAAKPN